MPWQKGWVGRSSKKPRSALRIGGLKPPRRSSAGPARSAGPAARPKLSLGAPVLAAYLVRQENPVSRG
jgi:hypothetical protein